jgi:hypothetical protein
MNQENTASKNSNYLRSKRETCIKCERRSQCILPIKDTEDEDTSLYNCEKYKAAKTEG